MITKGVLKSIDFNSNKCLVRLPLFETSINNELVYEATFSITPGIYNGYEVGDVVWVCFENGHMDTPVVVGKLYLGVNKESAQPRGVVNCKESIVSETAKIPVDTSLSSSTDKDIVDNKTPYKSLASVSSSLAALGENVGAMDLTYGNKFESVITDIGGLSSEIKQTATDISMKVDNKQSEKSFGWALTDSDWTIYRTAGLEEAEAKKDVQCTFFKIQKYNADLDETYDEWHLLINGCDTELTQAKVMDGYTDTAAKFLSDLVKNICSDAVPRLDINSKEWVVLTTNNETLTTDIPITNAAVLKANQDGLTVFGTIKATDGDIGRFIIGKSHGCTVENVHNGQASGIYSYGYYNSYEGTLDDTEKAFEQKDQKKYTQTLEDLCSYIQYNTTLAWDKFFNSKITTTVDDVIDFNLYNTTVEDNSNGLCAELYEKLISNIRGANIANQLNTDSSSDKKYTVSLTDINKKSIITWVNFFNYDKSDKSDNILVYNKANNEQQIKNIFKRFEQQIGDGSGNTWGDVINVRHREAEATGIVYKKKTDQKKIREEVGDSDGDGWFLYFGNEDEDKINRAKLTPLIVTDKTYFINVIYSAIKNLTSNFYVNYIERVAVQGVYVGTDGIRLGKDLRLGLDGTVYYKKLQYIGTDQKGDVRPNLQSGNSKYGESILCNTYAYEGDGGGKSPRSQVLSEDDLTKETALIKYDKDNQGSKATTYYNKKVYSNETYFIPISYRNNRYVIDGTCSSCLLLPTTGQKLESGKQYVVSFKGKLAEKTTENVSLTLSLRYTYSDINTDTIKVSGLKLGDLKQDSFIEDTLSWQTYPNNQDGHGVGGNYGSWTTFWYKFSTPSKDQFPDWEWENIQKSKVAICATVTGGSDRPVELPNDCYFQVKEIKLEEIPDGDTVEPSAFCYSPEDTLGGNGKGIAGADNLSKLTEAEWTAYTEGNTHKITLNKGFNIGDFVIISGVATDSGDTHTLFGEIISKILKDDSKWETGVNVQSHTVQKKGAQGKQGDKGNDGVGTSLVVIYRASAASALSGDSVVPSMNGTTTLNLKSADGGTWSAEPLTPTSSNPYVYATTYLAVVTNGTTKYYCNDKTKHTAEVVKYATLDSLISILSDGSVNLITKTTVEGKDYYSLNADHISGTIEDSVSIAGFKVTSNKLYAPKDATEPFGLDGTVMMCTGSTESKSIGGSKEQTGWCFTAGSKFGVTKNGDLYSSNCNIAGGSLKISSGAAGRYVQINSDGLNINGLSISATSNANKPSQGASDYTVTLVSGKEYTITRPKTESFGFDIVLKIVSSAGSVHYSAYFPPDKLSITVNCAIGPAAASGVTITSVSVQEVHDPGQNDVLTVNGQLVMYGAIDLAYTTTDSTVKNGICLNNSDGWYTGYWDSDYKNLTMKELEFVHPFKSKCYGVVATFVGNKNHTWFTTAIRDITNTGFMASGWAKTASRKNNGTDSDYPTKVYYYAWGV